MTRREPRSPDAVIQRLRATLDARAGDYQVTPGFAERVRQLRRRRRAVRHVNQAMAVAAVIVIAAMITVSALRPPDRLEFTSPPPVTPSPTATATEPPVLPAPSPSASPSPEADDTPSEPPTEAATSAVPEDGPPPADDEEPEPGPESAAEDTPSEEADTTPPRPRVFQDGERHPAPRTACRAADGAFTVTVDLPEAEGAVTLNSDPPFVTVYAEGPPIVADSADATSTADGWTIFTASFESNADEVGYSELRVEVPPRSDLEDCEGP